MLHVKDLYAGYGSGDVLHGITFDLPLGKNLCILGPNGCGKTTLLKSIAGLLESRGELTLDGKPIRSMRRPEIASHIAVMSQISTVYFSFSVYETVMMGRYQKLRRGLFSAPSPEDRRCVEGYLEATGLTPLRERQISELSGGQLQRVFLARTLAQEPEIILLDEPTSREKGRTVIGVLHDINLSLLLSDQLLFIKDGRIAGMGTAETTLHKGFLQQVYDMDVAEYMLGALKKWEQVS